MLVVMVARRCRTPNATVTVTAVATATAVTHRPDTETSTHDLGCSRRMNVGRSVVVCVSTIKRGADRTTYVGCALQWWSDEDSH